MYSKTEELLKKIVQKKESKNQYLLLNGSDHKIWLIPKDDISGGLNIYQPGSFKGRILKTFLPVLYKFPMILRILKIESFSFEMLPEIDEEIKSLFGNNKVNYSLYIGDTSFVNNRKIIIQISDNRYILGYAKYAYEDIVKKSFENEIITLNSLKEKGIAGIPSVLWHGNIGQLAGFIQSTEKNGSEKTVLSLTPHHWEFLVELNKKTKNTIIWEESKYKQILVNFEEDVRTSNWSCKEKLLKIIKDVELTFCQDGYVASFFHGDFTPWNICVKKEHIFVFDFEYSEFDMPEWMDIFHYITQVAIMSENKSSVEIYNDFLSNKKYFRQYMDNPELQYKCYLIYILAFYYKRWNGTISENERSTRVWLDLLFKLHGI